MTLSLRFCSQLHVHIQCIYMYFDFSRFIFPSVIVIFLSSLNCPLGLGQYMAGEVRFYIYFLMVMLKHQWGIDIQIHVPIYMYSKTGNFRLQESYAIISKIGRFTRISCKRNCLTLEFTKFLCYDFFTIFFLFYSISSSIICIFSCPIGKQWMSYLVTLHGHRVMRQILKMRKFCIIGQDLIKISLLHWCYLLLWE